MDKWVIRTPRVRNDAPVVPPTAPVPSASSLSSPMQATDVHDHVCDLVWEIFELHGEYDLRSAGLEDLFKSKEDIYEFMALPGLNFAPGLLDASTATTTPTLDFFKSLPQPTKKNYWAVYGLVMEKEGSKPRVYAGSACDLERGVEVRWRFYTGDPDAARLPKYVQSCLREGFAITHLGCFADMPAPSPINAPETRLFFRVLEATVTVRFWLFYHTQRNIKALILAKACPWNIKTLMYLGICSHTPLMEGIRGIGMAHDERMSLEARRVRRQNERDKQAARQEKRAELDMPIDVAARERLLARKKEILHMTDEEFKEHRAEIDGKKQAREEGYKTETQAQKDHRLRNIATSTAYAKRIRDPAEKRALNARREDKARRLAERDATETPAQRLKREKNNKATRERQERLKDPVKQAAWEAQRAEKEAALQAKRASWSPRTRRNREHDAAMHRKKAAKQAEEKRKNLVKRGLLVAKEEK